MKKRMETGEKSMQMELIFNLEKLIRAAHHSLSPNTVAKIVSNVHEYVTQIIETKYANQIQELMLQVQTLMQVIIQQQSNISTQIHQKDMP